MTEEQLDKIVKIREDLNLARDRSKRISDSLFTLGTTSVDHFCLLASDEDGNVISRTILDKPTYEAILKSEFEKVGREVDALKLEIYSVQIL